MTRCAASPAPCSTRRARMHARQLDKTKCDNKSNKNDVYTAVQGAVDIIVVITKTLYYHYYIIATITTSREGPLACSMLDAQGTGASSMLDTIYYYIIIIIIIII